MADPIQHGALERDDNGVPVGASYKNITTATTTTLKSTPGFLKSIVINKPGTTDTLTIYDSASASGTKIGTITVNANVANYDFNVTCATGLTVVSGGTAGDYTVIYV